MADALRWDISCWISLIPEGTWILLQELNRRGWLHQTEFDRDEAGACWSWRPAGHPPALSWSRGQESWQGSAIIQSGYGPDCPSFSVLNVFVLHFWELGVRSYENWLIWLMPFFYDTHQSFDSSLMYVMLLLRRSNNTTIILLHNLIEAVNAMAMMKNVGKLPDSSQNTIHCQNISFCRHFQGNSQKFHMKSNLKIS